MEKLEDDHMACLLEAGYGEPELRPMGHRSLQTSALEGTGRATARRTINSLQQGYVNPY